MLQRIRDNASGPIAYFIVGLISLVFGVWGIGSYFTENPDPPVAKAGGVEITKFELQRAYDRRRQRLQELMGDSFDPDMIEPERFRRDVLEGLVQEAQLRQYARDAGYRVTDDELLQALRAEERFQVEGRFSPERYRSLLSQAGIPAGAFEAGLREDLLVRQVRDGLLESSFVTHRAVAADYRLDKQRRQVAYLEFDSEALLDDVTVTDDDIRAHYDANPQAFTRLERVKLAYVEVDREELALEADPEEEFLRALYEREKETRFHTAERRRARHILVRVDGAPDAARRQIQSLGGELEQGADFAELARKHSDDEATAENGGRLGWINRGDRSGKFEETLFALEEGGVSAPVKTDAGWHLIKLEEIDPGKTRPFDDPEVRARLLELYRARERDQRFRQLSERLDSLSFEAPDSLRPLAEELDLEIQETGWITRSQGEGLGDYEAVRKAAFSDSVLKDRLNSTPIQLSSDRLVVMRVTEHQPGERRPLSAVRDEIAERLRREAAAEKARDLGRAAMQAVKDGRKLVEVAAEGPGKLHKPGWVTRNDESLDAALRETLFAMPRPKDGVGFALAELPDGGTALIRLFGVEPGRLPSAGSPPDLNERIRALRGRIAGLEYAAFRKSLEDDYKVEIYENRLD